MYKNGEAAIARILELVQRCPKDLQEKCFEALLNGYVQLEVGPKRAGTSGDQENLPADLKKESKPLATGVPEAALARFKNTAKRMGLSVDKLAALFDFSIDPFVYHALTLPGRNMAVKARQVALLAAARAYLASGTWSADWKEIKALCVDHNCYDSPNHAANLKQGLNDVFKSLDPRKSVELSNQGIKNAETLLKELCEFEAP